MNRSILVPVLIAMLASTAACGGEADTPRTGASTAAATTARGGGDADAEMAEIRAHRLSRAGVERWFQAQRNVYEAMRRDPSIAARLKATEDRDVGEVSLDELEAHYGAIPAVRGGIEAAGLEVREFGVILYALFQASFAQAGIEMGASRDSILDRTGVHPANLDFVRDNKDWLQRMQTEVAALAPEDAEEADDDME